MRRSGKPLTLVVNKTDGLDEQSALGDFHALGLGEPQPISAVHGRGVERLMRTALAHCPRPRTAKT